MKSDDETVFLSYRKFHLESGHLISYQIYAMLYIKHFVTSVHYAITDRQFHIYLQMVSENGFERVKTSKYTIKAYVLTFTSPTSRAMLLINGAMYVIQ